MAAPVLINPIPAQVINEQAAYGPFDLNTYIHLADEATGSINFRAELRNGDALPKGLICTADGIVTGIPAKGTQGTYEVVLTVAAGEESMQTTFGFTIRPSLLASSTEYLDQLKGQVWEALHQQLPVPELADIYDRPITTLDLYYLLERWSTLTMYDAFNLEPPGAKTLLDLKGVSKHYQVYDKGSCLIGCPKDLFSHERTLEDGLQTARAMAQEVHRRGWTIELVGLSKMSRAAWVEIQRLNDESGKRLEIINFSPSSEDIKLYVKQSESRSLKRGME